MRKWSKCMMAVLFAIVFMASQTAVIGAQTKEDEHVTVKQELSKSEEENVIKGKVFVTNNGTDDVKNVLIQSTLPEGLQLKEGYTLEKEIERIESGDTVVHEFEAVYEVQGQAGGDETPATETPSVTEQPEATNTPATQQPSATEKPGEDTTTPQTDDSEDIIFYMMGIIGAGSIIAYLIKNKKVKFTKALAIMLCTTMALGMGAMPNIQAEEGTATRKSITVTDTITAEEQEFEIQSKITYEVSETVLPPSEDATIIGTIAQADNRTSFIEGATIEFFTMEGNRVVQTVTSDVNGSYTTVLRAATYRIKIAAPGYVPFECIETLEAGEEKHLETYLMVPVGEEGEQGIAGGTIKNAVTGETVEGVTIKVRTGWNQTEGETIATTVTDEHGFYQASLPLGNYTVEMSKGGYITGKYNIIARSGQFLDQNAVIVPNATTLPTGDLRIVLTWGEEPHDLDSHLFGPAADGIGRFHVSYGTRRYEKDGIKYADLDIDDRYCYGPETTTIYKVTPNGKYNFFVHDYTNGGDWNCKEMSNSGAMVKIYRGENLVKEFSIPSNQKGILWHVFDYDPVTDTIIPVNKYTNTFIVPDNRSANTQFSIMNLQKTDK